MLRLITMKVRLESCWQLGKPRLKKPIKTSGTGVLASERKEETDGGQEDSHDCGGLCRGLRGDGPLSDVDHGRPHGSRGLSWQEGRRDCANSRPRLRGRPDLQREAGP